MNFHHCPHCGKPGISGFKKLLIGPFSKVKCVYCNGKVGVPGWTGLLNLPMAFAYIFKDLITTDATWSFFLGLFAAVLTFSAHEVFTHLEKR